MPRYPVVDWVDVYHVQRCTLQFAAAIGFQKRVCSEMAIVASELTSNILKYGISGSIELEAIQDERGVGIAVIATDCGPPFKDLGAAVRDGWNDQGPIDPLDMVRRRGIGGGLGAVLRLTDDFRHEALSVGKRIRVVRYLETPAMPNHSPKPRPTR